MRSHSLISAFPLVSAFSLISLVACGGSGNDDTGSKGTGDENAWAMCTQVESSVGFAEVVPSLAASAADLSQGLSAAYTAEGAWVADGAAATVQIGVTLGESVVYVDQEANTGDGGDGGIEPAIAEDTSGSVDECPDYLRLSGAFTLATADGVLNEAFDGELILYAPGEGSVNVEIPLAEVGGTWSDPEYDPADWDTVALRIEATVRADATNSGKVYVFATETSGEGEDGTASATQGELLSWPLSADL